MKILPFLIFILLFINACTESDNTEGWIDAGLFLDPPVDYWSAPFYSLIDELDTTEIIRQINGFKDGGFGGSFLHSRGGLLTEYMGTEWWEAMDTPVRSSKELGINTITSISYVKT